MSNQRRSKFSALKQSLEAIQKDDSPQAEAFIEVTNLTITLAQIRDRASGDTRPLNPSHVEELAKSISLLGLIEPLVVDNQNRLLAGGHRRAAILQIWEEQPKAFKQHFADGIPVYRIDIDSEAQPELAVKIEIAENEQRRDYTPAEVRAIADRFRKAGLSGDRGRPAKGEQPLIPALMAVIGKSRTTVKRYLKEQAENGPNGPFSDPDYDRILRRIHKDLVKWLEKPYKSVAEEAAANKFYDTVNAIVDLLKQ